MTDTPNTSPRRRWLRRTALGVMAAGIAAGVGWKAFAAGEHGGRHGGFLSAAMDPADMDKHLERMLKHLYVEIDASDAQKAKLDPIVKAAAKDLMPVRAKLRAARKQAMDLLTQDTIDRGAIEALRAEQVALAGDATR
ncbi:MAG: periplasmic heavy metal sensor, partial [Proteobacteria bacterium]|nr:periplasmic heavy metal sensor [Pseudomonadota bacterium]